MIFRTAIAVLLLNAWNMSAQSLMMPERYDPSRLAVSPLYKQDTVKIRFFGDIMMHSLQIDTARGEDGSFDFSTYYELMEDYLADSDLNVGNMEFTLGGEPYTGYPAFSAPDSFAAYLADIGFNIFLCANNHIFDKGRNGLVRTLEIYRKLAESQGIRFTGAAGDEAEWDKNNPLIINIKGIRIAFVNATYGTNSYRGDGWPKTNILGDTQKLGKALETADTKADLTVALVHWSMAKPRDCKRDGWQRMVQTSS